MTDSEAAIEAQLPVEETFSVNPYTENLPEELKELYDNLYKKISDMVGGRVIDGRSDVRLIKIILENSMEIVEKFRNQDGKGWSGYEKKEHALDMAKYIIWHLQSDGKIKDEVAATILDGLEIFGSVAIDMAIDAIKKVFDVGQDIVEKGCEGCCERNKCCIA